MVYFDNELFDTNFESYNGMQDAGEIQFEQQIS